MRSGSADDRVGDRDLVSVAPLQLGRAVFYERIDLVPDSQTP